MQKVQLIKQNNKTKINKLFLIIIGLEIVIIIISLIFGNRCGSACDPHSFLNPFGYVPPNKESILCIQMCVYTPHPIFYLTTDLLILTIFLYLIYWTVKIIKRLKINKE